MMRSLYSGVSGLQNHQTRMDVIGNNISNVNTTGFKRGRVNFQDMISQQLAGAAKPTEELGGVNPKDVGLGMTIATIEQVFTQGNLQSTGVSTDVAIQGNGFFIVKDGEESFYTRNGVFGLDRDGTLVNPANGMRVQGWMARDLNGEQIVQTAATPTDLVIPVGSKDPARETSNVLFACNLNKNTPEIIEGASEGVGLGIQFLRHIERTRLLLHVIDCSGSEGRDPVEDFEIINKELKNYSKKLSERKQIIVANKVDVMQDETGYKKLEKMAKEKGIEIFKISAVTGQGLKELFVRVSEVLKTLPKEDLIDVEDKVVYTLKEDEKQFEVKVENGEFIVTGPAIEKLMGRINIGDNESMSYFERNLAELGINDALRAKGVKEGDTVKFLDWEFEWFDY